MVVDTLSLWAHMCLFSSSVGTPLYFYVVELTLEQHRFELLWSPYMQIFFYKYNTVLSVYFCFVIF